MSGIVGIYNLDSQPVERQKLALMVDAIAHRGPDGADIWCAGSIGLGHRMLWTTPESLLERLPLVNAAGDIVITADLRIDNRDELICALQLDNLPPEKITDTDLVLAAYEKWDEQCPEHLLGDFAFAIWDSKKQTLFCARDHMGVKPFYYYHKPGKLFTFGSEIKALLSQEAVTRKLNEVKVGDFLAAILQDQSITFYQDIFRLPPASWMSVSPTGIKISSYWSLDPHREVRLNSDEEYAEALQKIFAEAVRCRLRSAFPIGSHLSGGLDSSAVTSMARHVLAQAGDNRPLHTFSNIFDAFPESDERPFIASVTEQGGMIPHFVHADQKGPLSDLDHIFQYQDEAIPAPTHFLIWGLNNAAANAGVRVVLDGFDGDNTISHGEGYLVELARKGDWGTFAQETLELSNLLSSSQRQTLENYGLPYLAELARKGKWLKFVQEVNNLTKYFRVSKRSLFLRQGLKPLLPEFVTAAISSRRSKKDEPQDETLINPRFFRRIGLKKRIQTLKKARRIHLPTERELHHRYITAGILTQGLEIIDHYGAAFGLDYRHPYMDKRLIEFCLSLPPEQKLNQGWSRLVMRRAMRGILPEKVRSRRDKSDMSPSFVYGLLNHNRGVLDEFIQNHLSNIQDYANTNTVNQIYEQLTSPNSKFNHKQSSIDLLLWKAAMLALWLNHAQPER